MKTEIRYVNPELAQELLKLNTNNRPLCPARVTTYAEKMKSGAWKENGESIVITDRPRLGSGQHRLHAIVKSGMAYNMVIVTGVCDDYFPTLDTGKPRTASNVLSCEGFRNSTKIAATLSAINNYSAASCSVWNTGKGADVIRSYADEYGDVSEFANLAERVRGGCGARSSLIAGALFWMNLLDRPKMLDFAEKMASGIGLQPGDPEVLLRARLSMDSGAKARLQKVEYAAIIAVAVNAKLRGKKLNSLKWNNETAFPAISK